MKTAVMLSIVILASSLGDVLIAKGMKRVGEISTLRLRELAWIGKSIVCNAPFLLGLLCMAISFGAFLALLSWADLSFVVPATSLSFVVTTLGAKWLLQERIDHLRWIGTLLVCVGVALLSLP
jgi:drug/metabolite transporter (DMT)-like permease